VAVQWARHNQADPFPYKLWSTELSGDDGGVLTYGGEFKTKNELVFKLHDYTNGLKDMRFIKAARDYSPLYANPLELVQDEDSSYNVTTDGTREYDFYHRNCQMHVRGILKLVRQTH
jgi:hypothetical protein